MTELPSSQERERMLAPISRRFLDRAMDHMADLARQDGGEIAITNSPDKAKWWIVFYFPVRNEEDAEAIHGAISGQREVAEDPAWENEMGMKETLLEEALYDLAEKYGKESAVGHIIMGMLEERTKKVKT